MLFQYIPLFVVQRTGEWLVISLLSAIFLLVSELERDSILEISRIYNSLFMMLLYWAFIFVFSGWIFVSILGLIFYWNFRRSELYALSSLLLSGALSAAWLGVMVFLSADKLGTWLVPYLSLWLLGLASNYFVALFAHRWLIRWPDPVPA